MNGIAAFGLKIIVWCSFFPCCYVRYLPQEPIISLRNDLTQNGELEDPQPALPCNLLSLLNLNYCVLPVAFRDDPEVWVDAVEWNDELLFFYSTPSSCCSESCVYSCWAVDSTKHHRRSGRMVVREAHPTGTLYVVSINSSSPPSRFIVAARELSLIHIKPGLHRLGNKLWRFKSHSPVLSPRSSAAAFQTKNPFRASVMEQSLAVISAVAASSQRSVVIACVMWLGE